MTEAELLGVVAQLAGVRIAEILLSADMGVRTVQHGERAGPKQPRAREYSTREARGSGGRRRQQAQISRRRTSTVYMQQS